MTAHMSAAEQIEAARKVASPRLGAEQRAALLGDLLGARYEDGMVRTAFNIIHMVAGTLPEPDGEMRAASDVLRDIAEHCAAVVELSMSPEAIFEGLLR